VGDERLRMYIEERGEKENLKIYIGREGRMENGEEVMEKIE
jgi:hypothetical protein